MNKTYETWHCNLYLISQLMSKLQIWWCTFPKTSNRSSHFLLLMLTLMFLCFRIFMQSNKEDLWWCSRDCVEAHRRLQAYADGKFLPCSSLGHTEHTCVIYKGRTDEKDPTSVETIAILTVSWMQANIFLNLKETCEMVCKPLRKRARNQRGTHLHIQRSGQHVDFHMFCWVAWCT